MSIDTVDRTASRPEAAPLETPGRRRQRISTGILIAGVGVLLLVGLASTDGSARFALSDAFDEVQLPTVTVPGFTTVLVCGLLCLAAAVGYLSGSLRGRWPVLAGAVAGLAVVMGFLTWAASGRELPFPVSNQFAGTLSLATPLVFGALCGVLCERSGIVNVSIEGQFLSAAFAAAIVGSLTSSVPAALIAAVLA
ncbi:MAG TPA: ABC transporter permease, partial [Propionibacteriaceae bacterium]|nr:ABC transporter permease [Propionibacteriaceae bacterium]